MSFSLGLQVRVSSTSINALAPPRLLPLTWRIFYWLGTGKSLLLRAIIAALKKKHAKKPAVVSVTASTGMAASNIGGT